MFNESFFDSLLKQGYNNRAVARIVQHLAWENTTLTVWIAKILFHAMWKCEPHQFHNTLSLLEELLKIQDSIHIWRIAVLLNSKNGGLLEVLTRMTNTNNFLPFKIDELLTFLLNLIETNVLFAGYLFETRHDWAPAIEKFLLQNKRQIETFPTSEHQLELKRWDDFLKRFRAFWEGTNTEIVYVWDGSFTLSDFPIQGIPDFDRS